MQKLMSSREAATFLAISPRTLWTIVDRGELAAVKIGRSVRFDPADLIAFVERAKTRPASVLAA
ncbi:helix-turn-helix domain-containing protein [Humisphaera borealis]|uniref:Helix-turn-helix domain-containing protein n=1 Tax=Humisphaera borealis TaxID=2807512 RepID=A0A7M2WZF1_9BACT|nr:helix-turn-helix domain-containing protein [Humisphaera borealis]QOV90572.1 helix-turn-helix domain-containing protein [Humisphaera borealis]